MLALGPVRSVRKIVLWPLALAVQVSSWSTCMRYTIFRVPAGSWSRKSVSVLIAAVGASAAFERPGLPRPTRRVSYSISGSHEPKRHTLLDQHHAKSRCDAVGEVVPFGTEETESRAKIWLLRAYLAYMAADLKLCLLHINRLC